MDTSQNFVPIPPLPSSDDLLNNNRYFVAVSNERLDAANNQGALSAGEIAALVIGLVIAFLITVAVVVFLFVMHKRRQRKPKEKKRNSHLIVQFSSSLYHFLNFFSNIFQSDSTNTKVNRKLLLF